MLKKLLGKKDGFAQEEARARLTLELAEVEEISERIFRKIDERLKALQAAEARLDEKAREVEALVARAGGIAAVHRDMVEARRTEVLALARGGLDVEGIARLFDMTKGEVELILNLGGK
ncbi:MAG: hypothetical protein HY896_03010 [Deltaproteobacteria bacterium]|nr:hypothetical protein [Deltaproteobacteria bacterium]